VYTKLAFLRGCYCVARHGAWAALLLGAAATIAVAQEPQDPFRSLVQRLPRNANAVAILNLEKAFDSPLAIREGWKKNMEKAFETGLTRVPPGAKRFVLGAELDFEFWKPVWEGAVAEFNTPISLESVAARRHGELDQVREVPAVVLPNDVYLLQFDQRTLAAYAPANRQLVDRWIRDAQAGVALSPYLQQAARYSDKSSSEIILAVDLDEAVSLERIVKYLKAKDAVAKLGINIQTLADVLRSVRGFRMGIRLAEPPTAAVVVDFKKNVELEPSAAQKLLLQVLGDGGLMVDDFTYWRCSVSGTEVKLQGSLSKSGLRQVLSLLESPTSSESVAKEAPKPTPTAATPQSPGDAMAQSAGDAMAQKAQASLKHYRAVTKMFDDLKESMHNGGPLSQKKVFFDRYANKIEKLPILGVDQDLLNYSAFVASSLRAAAGSMRTSGIQNAQQQAHVARAGVYGDYAYGYGYRSGWDVSADRSGIRADLKAGSVTDVYSVRGQIIAATTDIRRKMTQRYQIEF
jgi:hypothetical protein